MRNKLFTFAGALALTAVLGKFYAVPALAQGIRAALVKNIDEKGRTPYMEYTVRSCTGGGPNVCELVFPPVPPGKRLIVEQVNAGVSLASGGLRFAALVAPPNVVFLLPARSLSDSNLFVVNESVLTYFESGQTPLVRIGFTAPADVPAVNAAISGYLADLGG